LNVRVNARPNACITRLGVERVVAVSQSVSCGAVRLLVSDMRNRHAVM
jgi:hypothetical protein